MTLVDNNVLSSLAKIDRLGLLNSLFEEVSTTPSVLDELQSDKVSGYDFVNRLDAVKRDDDGSLHLRSPRERDSALTEEIEDEA